MKPQTLPAGTSVTIELRGKGKSEYVDGTIVGCKGKKIVVKTFDGRECRVDPDCVWKDPEDQAEREIFDEVAEEEKRDDDVRKWGKWPEFDPTTKPASIQ